MNALKTTDRLHCKCFSTKPTEYLGRNALFTLIFSFIKQRKMCFEPVIPNTTDFGLCSLQRQTPVNIDLKTAIIHLISESLVLCDLYPSMNQANSLKHLKSKSYNFSISYLRANTSLCLTCLIHVTPTVLYRITVTVQK